MFVGGGSQISGLYEYAKKKLDLILETNKYISDGDKDKERNFTLIYKAICPTVLTENMFMDSKKDLEFLKSDEGVRKLLNVHIAGIHKYFNGPVSRI